MHRYQTKIINFLDRVRLQVAADHINDFAAIRAAKKLCRAGDTAEVWRDDICIYNERPPKPIALVWPVISGKAKGNAEYAKPFCPKIDA